MPMNPSLGLFKPCIYQDPPLSSGLTFSSLIYNFTVAEAEGKLTPLEERGLFLYCFLLLPLSFLNLGPWTPSAGTPDGWAA